MKIRKFSTTFLNKEKYRLYEFSQAKAFSFGAIFFFHVHVDKWQGISRLVWHLSFNKVEAFAYSAGIQGIFLAQYFVLTLGGRTGRPPQKQLKTAGTIKRQKNIHRIAPEMLLYVKQVNS